MISYDTVTLVPRKISSIKSRSTVDTSVSCFNTKLSYPLVTAPMPDVCNGRMAGNIAGLGGLSLIHRFQTIEEQISQFHDAFEFLPSKLTSSPEETRNANERIGCAIGINGDYEERFEKLYSVGCRIFCIDTANGANTRVGDVVRMMKEYADKSHTKIYVIAGNIATKEGYEYLADVGADAVRVGIAGGSVCETKTETGVHMPTLQSVKEIADWRDEVDSYTIVHSNFPLIIADGGIKTPGDANKALAVGADLVMVGSILSGTTESPGSVLGPFDGKLYKLYRGAASFSVQRDANGNSPKYVEGRESMVQYKGKVELVFSRFKGGLESCMSYFNSRTLEEFKVNVSVERI